MKSQEKNLNIEKKSYPLHCKACNKLLEYNLNDYLCIDCLGSVDFLEDIFDIEVEDMIYDL